MPHVCPHTLPESLMQESRPALPSPCGPSAVVPGLDVFSLVLPFPRHASFRRFNKTGRQRGEIIFQIPWRWTTMQKRRWRVIADTPLERTDATAAPARKAAFRRAALADVVPIRARPAASWVPCSSTTSSFGYRSAHLLFQGSAEHSTSLLVPEPRACTARPRHPASLTGLQRPALPSPHALHHGSAPACLPAANHSANVPGGSPARPSIRGDDLLPQRRAAPYLQLPG